MQPLEPGPCTKFIERYYFDVTTRKCTKFQYGGCRGIKKKSFLFVKIFIEFLGNENNFMTHDECEAMCDELIQDHKSSIFD
jgi:hypothetical protein